MSSAHRSPWHRARANSSQDCAARGPVTLTLNAFASAGILPTEVFNHRFWVAHWTDWRRTDCAQFYLVPLGDVPALAVEGRQIVLSGTSTVRHELEPSWATWLRQANARSPTARVPSGADAGPR